MTLVLSHRLKIGIGVSASFPAVILLLLAVSSTSAVVAGRVASTPAPVVPVLPRGRPGLLGLWQEGLGAGRWAAALGAALLVTRHLAHLDEAAVEARQVLQGTIVLHPH